MALEFMRTVKNGEKKNELVLEGSRFKIGLNVDRYYNVDGDSKSIYGTIDLIMEDSVIGRATFNHKINPKGETGVVYAFNKPGAFGFERVIKNKDVFFIHEIKNKSKAVIKTALRNGKPYFVNEGDISTYYVNYKYSCVYKYTRKVTPLEIRTSKRLVTLSKNEERYQKGFNFIHDHIFKLTENIVYYNRTNTDEKYKFTNMYHNTKYKNGHIISQSGNDVKIIAYAPYRALMHGDIVNIYKEFHLTDDCNVRIAVIYYEGSDMFIEYKSIKPIINKEQEDEICMASGYNIETDRTYIFHNGDLSNVCDYKKDYTHNIDIDKHGYVTDVYDVDNDNGYIFNKLISDNEYAISLDPIGKNLRLQKKYKFGEEVKCLCSLPIGNYSLDENKDTNTTMAMLRLFAFSDFEIVRNGILRDAEMEHTLRYINTVYNWYDKIVDGYYSNACKKVYKVFKDKFTTQMWNYITMMTKTFGDEIQSFRFYIKNHDNTNLILCCESFHYSRASEHKTLRIEYVTNQSKNRLDKLSERVPEEVTSKCLDGVSTSRLKSTTRYTLLPNRILKGLPNVATNYNNKDGLMVDLYNMIVDRYANVTSDYDISKDEVFDIINHL